MTDVLFIITTLFVAYVVYVIVNEKRNEGSAKQPSTKASSAPQPLMSEENKPAPVAKDSTVKTKPAAVKVVAKPASEKAAEKPEAAKATSAKTAKPAETKNDAEMPEVALPKGSGLKDPKTGEVATTYTNYRFTKRWIKEALVAEGLIDKIYKNDELNADVESKLKTAIAKLEGIKKYQP